MSISILERAKQSYLSKTPDSAFDFLFNVGSDTVNAMTEERFSDPIYDKINSIMEESYGNKN